VDAVRGMVKGCRIYNHYGPSECTVGAVAEEVSGSGGVEDRGSVALGRPLGNTQVYVLDQQGEVAPLGVAGEMYIGGLGVGRGYLNRGDLTGERFVPDAFVGERGARMYRTGDLGRWREDGTIEFLGRNDFQVKIRGYRIELGEIEARLAEHTGVRDVVVIAREDTAGDKRLVAYYTSRTGADGGKEGSWGSEAGLGAEQLRAHVGEKLPEYMVPAAYVRLEKLPLTPNGKLDRKALPAPEEEAYGVRGYEAPVGETERVLAKIWAEVLQVERVGRHDNFFELGGHSLLAVKLIARLRRASLDMDVRALFAKPTLAELATAIGQTTRVAVPANGIPKVRQKELSKGVEIRI
jgi:acyl-coenzyme A synthetase/AMP-(fatty) acid ligase/aryl carrier-like protein